MKGNTKLKILHLISSIGPNSGAIRTLSVLSAGCQSQGHDLSAVFYTRPEGESAHALRRQGVTVANLGWGKDNLNRIERFRLFLRLSQRMMGAGVDVLHAHHWDADFFGAIAYSWRPVRKIVTIHSLSYIDWVNGHASRYRSLIVPRIDHFVCVSEDLKKALNACQVIPEEKISVIHNSAPDEFLAPCHGSQRQHAREEFRVLGDEILIGAIGNLTWCKGIEYLLQAMQQIKSGRLKLLLVGAHDGAMQETYDHFLQDADLASRVIFAGYRTDIPRLLEAIDIFVLPSVVEADPWALTEAMAKAKPIIATRVGGVPEKIQNGTTGFLVEARDSQALAEKIGYFMDHPVVGQEMGRSARRFIEENFSSRAMVNKYLALYQ